MIRPAGITPVPDCHNCALRSHSNTPVWGRGCGREDPNSLGIMIIGEAPGLQEDQQHRPFYEGAPAGGLLTEVLKELGVSRSQVYVTNSVRCFPGYDVEVKAEHIKACKGYLEEEIRAVDPKLIVLMGNKALKSVFGREGITKERGKLQTGPDGRLYLPTLHPAGALPSRMPEGRHIIKSDLRQALKIAARDGADPLADLDLKLVSSLTQLDMLNRELSNLPSDTVVFWDFETNNLRTPFQTGVPGPLISGMALCWSDTEAWFVPYEHQNPIDGWYASYKATVGKFLRSFLTSTQPKGGQNLKYDCLWAEGHLGVRVSNVTVDTMLLSHLIDPSRGIHGEEKLALQVGLAGYAEPLHQWFIENKIAQKEQDWSKAPLELVARKSMGDVVVSRRYYYLRRPAIEKRGQATLYDKHVVPGMWPYVTMEREGMLIDVPYLDQLEARYEQRRAETVERMKQFATQAGFKLAEDFNFNSVDQLGKLLDDWLVRTHIDLSDMPVDHERPARKRDYSRNKDVSLDRLARTTSGRMSVDKGNLDALISHSNLYPELQGFLKALRRYKGDSKRVNTYVQGLRKHICPDGRVRSSYLLHGTETGRRSSASPNRQNDPVDTEVRRLYITPPGYVFVVNDYSNLEVRVAAALSKDPNLIQAFRDGRDIHTYVTSMAYNQDYERMVMVMKNADQYPQEYGKYFRMRDNCKRAMWTTLFGGGAAKIALLTELSEEAAARLLDRITVELFPGLRKMFRRFERLALEKGYTQNAFGRWRPLMGIDSTDQGVQAAALRQALNTPVQSSAADITYMAARRLNSYLEKHGLDARLVLEVHDSLVPETHIDCLYDVLVASRRIMETITVPGAPEVPLKIDQVVGCHLGSKVKVSAEVLEQARNDPHQLYRQLRVDLKQPPQFYEKFNAAA